MLIDPKTLPTASQLQEFFFDAMNAVGWASDTPMVREHPILKGWMMTTYKGDIGNNTLMLADQWCDTRGFTTINLLLNDFPHIIIGLWHMHYCGSYPKYLIPAVKIALGATYKERVFCCGRGFETYWPTSAIKYCNDGGGDFTFFHGSEVIMEDTSEGARGGPVWTSQGGHSFWGGMMFPEPQK